MARALKPEHLQAAFQAMAWAGWTYEAAMADPVRKVVVSWRARQLCDAQARAQAQAGRRVVTVCGASGTGATRFTGPKYTVVTDFKRLAAGDRDD